MSQQLTEDDIYRTSTQYRLWSFSPESLASLRTSTHAAALARAKAYLAQDAGTVVAGVEQQCLTLEEEARLVQRYCEQVRTTSDHFKWPVNVKATAVQYLKRFYLTNSCITYPPKEMYKTVLFLASKTEGVHMTLSEYARRISSAPEHILAPEYKIIQALRFTLDVRQPFRGLKGALMELLNLADANAAVLSSESRSAATLAQAMAALPAPASGSRTPWTPLAQRDAASTAERAHAAYAGARLLLDAPALLTDVYFLYTPPQIYLAALQLSDPVLADFFLSTKLPLDSPVRGRVLATITDCAAMLGAFGPGTVMSKEERAGLETKLDACRHPATMDLVGANAKAKRDGVEEGKVDDGVAKRRKLQRETSAKEAEDLFGPSLSAAGKAEVGTA